MQRHIFVVLLFLYFNNQADSALARFKNKLLYVFKTEVKFKEGNLIGLTKTMPEKLYRVISKIENGEINHLNNRIIIHGPPGNGKSAIAKAIADKIDAKVYSQSGSSIVGTYQNSGSEQSYF